MKLTDKQLGDYVTGKLALPGDDRDDRRKQIGRLLEKLETKIHEDGSYRIKKFRRAGSLETGALEDDLEDPVTRVVEVV